MNVLARSKLKGRLIFALFFFLSLGGVAFGIKPKTLQTLPPSPEEQRTLVQKDLYLSQGGERLHSRIACPASTLKIDKQSGERRLIETMHRMHALMQHKFEGDDQQVRTFTAAEGTYDYTARTFSADSVLLSFHHLAGHTLPQSLSDETAFLSGVAEHVKLLIDNKSPDFKAEKFKAKVKLE